MTQKLNRLALSSDYSFHPPLVSSDGSSFCYFQSWQGLQSSLALQHFFFLNLILTVRLWSSLIIIHGSSAGESSSWCVWQQCGGPLCMLLSCLSWGCHSLFVHPLAASLLGFHFRKNLLRSSSLCAQPACSNSTWVTFSKDGAWISVTNLTGFTFLQDMFLLPILSFWIGTVIFMSREVCSVFFQLKMLQFL